MAFPDRDNPTHDYDRHRKWDMKPGFAPNTPVGGQGTLFRGGPRWVERPEYMDLNDDYLEDRASELVDPVARGRYYSATERNYTEARREAGRQYADRIRTIRSASGEGVRIYADSDKVPQMVKDGSYKSQHLTGTSNGSTDMEMRQSAEDFFGYDKPVYGSVGHHDAAMDHYGETELHLKPSESWRVTVSDGDTLDRYADTQFYGGWTHKADPYGEHLVAPLRQVRSSPGHPGLSVDLTHESPYIEAIIETGGSGELPMSAFDRAVVPGAGAYMPESNAVQDRNAAADALEGVGINVQRSSTSYQQPLPMFSDMPTHPDTGLINWGKAPGRGTTWDVAPMTKNYGTTLESNTDYKRRKAREAQDT